MDMIFTLADIEPDASAALDSWFRASETLDSVCGLFFAIYYNPRMFVEQRFLNLVFALESYHRRRVRNAAVSDVKHSLRVAALLGKAPQKYRKWLRYRLRYSNEPDLRQRLKDLLLRAALLADELLPDSKRFLDKVTSTRNYYTHYDASLRDRAARAADSLYWGSEVLRTLLTDCLLSELGIPADKRAQRIRERPNYPMIAKGVRRFLEG
jgi:Apea-like HEPN